MKYRLPSRVESTGARRSGEVNFLERTRRWKFECEGGARRVGFWLAGLFLGGQHEAFGGSRKWQGGRAVGWRSITEYKVGGVRDDGLLARTRVATVRRYRTQDIP